MANSAVRQTRDTSVQDNNSSTSSRMASFASNAVVSGTRDRRPYLNSFLRNEATKAAYICLFDYAYDDETKWFDSLVPIKVVHG